MTRLLVDGRDVAPLEFATTARTRRKGLLGRHTLDGALWLAPAKQVHTFRMKFALDVAHVDRELRIVRVLKMPPGRLGPLLWSSHGVLEAELGSFEKWGLTSGATVTFTTLGDAVS